MKNITLVLCLTLASLSSFAQTAPNYFNKNESCLSKADVKAIQSHFRQFSDFTGTSKDKICRNDMNEKWFEVIRSTLALQRLNVTSLLQRDPQDDFTLRPIGQRDWWTYYTQRANQYVIEPARCNGNPNVVAFVYPFFRGSINLCPRFFEMDPASQMEVLMHEVRHFDGHPHVTCTQGNEEGNDGACDSNIKNGGSYAVSVQAGVELSYVNQLDEADRILSESSAIYSINNKFNSLPTVKSEEFIYAANATGEVYRMPHANPANLELVTRMENPAMVYGNGQQFTVFPVETSNDAYRISKGFKVHAEAIGAFANMFNADNESQRELYGPVNYYGDGAIAKDNSLHTFCGEQATGMSEFKFRNGDIKALPVMKKADGSDEMFIMNASGDLYNFVCNQRTGKLTSRASNTSLPAQTAMAYAVNGETAVLLTDSGEIKEYNLKSEVITSDLSDRSDWISVTPLKIYNVFEKSL